MTDAFVVRAASGQLVAELDLASYGQEHAGCGTLPLATQQARANALLIAAAPELYAALVEVLHYAETLEEFTKEEAQPVLLNASVALTKAEGGTP